MKYPILYPADETSFLNAGLGLLKNALQAQVIEERNGAFYFEATVSQDEDVFPLIEEEQIILADAGHKLKDQRFRIRKIVDNHDGTSKLFAEHVSYITRELTFNPSVRVVSSSASQALNTWKNNILEESPITVESDITTPNNAFWRIQDVENPRRVLGGVEGSILDVWGGEYEFDNYHIKLMKKRGTQANIVLSYGRNITSLEAVKSTVEVYTSIYPYAIYTDEEDNEHLVAIDGLVVDVDNLAQFPNRRTLPVDFSSEFDSENIPTKAKLVSLAQKYISDNNVGVPKLSLKVNFVDLSKTADYADLKELETINLCDDVFVSYPKLNIQTVEKVVRIVWNVLDESYDEIEIGDKQTTLGTRLNNFEREQKRTNNQIKDLTFEVGTSILAANGKNKIFYGLFGEDGLGQPVASLVGDLWFKPDGEEWIMFIWNGAEWEERLSTKRFTMIEEEIAEFEQDLSNQLVKIEEGLEKAEEALEEAGFAKDIAENAEQIAENAIADASNALAQANLAKADATQAKADAGLALTDASTALSDASTALGKANTALNNATEAVDSVTALSLIVDDVSGELELKATQTEVNTLTGRVSSAEAGISANATQINLRATKTEVNTLAGRVTDAEASITLQSDAIALKANQTTVDTLAGRVTNAEASITLNSNAIALKASQSSVDTLASRVTDAEASITLNSDAIALKANQSVVDTLTGRVSTAEASITVNSNNIALKANQTTVDTLTGRVSTAETTIVSHATQINLRATKTEVNAISDDLSDLQNEVSTVSSDLSVEAGKITALNTKTDGHATSIGTLQSSYSGLSSTVSQVQTDLDGKVSTTAFSALEQNLNGFKTTVSSTYETKSVVSQLATQWQATVTLVNGHTGQISNLGDQINLRVTQAQVDASILADKKVKDTRGSNQLPSWYVTNYPSQTVVELKNRTDLSLPTGTTGTYAQLTTIVTSGNVRQTVLTDSGEFKRSGSSSTWGAWAKVSDSTNTISQINLSSEGVVIQGSKIQITGDTYIQNGVIKSAHIYSLIATKITSGTLDGALVNVINLNAGSISSGYMNVSRLNGDIATFVTTAWNSAYSYMKASASGLTITQTTTSWTMELTRTGMQFSVSDLAVGMISLNTSANMRFGIIGSGVMQFQSGTRSSNGVVNWTNRMSIGSGGVAVSGVLSATTAETGTLRASNYNAPSGTEGPIEINIGGTTALIKFGIIIFNGTPYPALLSANRTAGIMFAGSQLYYINNNVAYTFSGIERKGIIV